MGMMLVTKAERTEGDSLSSFHISSVTFSSFSTPPFLPDEAQGRGTWCLCLL